MQKKGSNVKKELLYIDMLNHLEHIGDFAFSIAVAQSETPRFEHAEDEDE